MVIGLQHDTWMDGERFKRTCINEKGKRGDIHQPFCGTWVADFILRQNADEIMTGKYLSDIQIPEAIEELRKEQQQEQRRFWSK